MIDRLAVVPLSVAALAASVSVAGSQSPPATGREIDNHSGISFFCKPLAREAWTQRVCEEVAAEMTAWGLRAKKPVIILKSSDTPQQKSEQAKAAGFDPKQGLWILLTIEPDAQSGWGWELVVRADGHARPATPGDVPRTVTYSKRATTVTTNLVAEKSKELLGAIMTVLTSHMRPL